MIVYQWFFLNYAVYVPSSVAPCKISLKRATVLFNGQKIKANALNTIQHAETIWFFCQRETENCGYKTPAQCIDGQLSIPDCFEGMNIFFFWLTREKMIQRFLH